VARRGLFTRPIKAGGIITTFAGIGKYVESDKQQVKGSTHYHTLLEAGQSKETYVIDGFKKPQLGYGLAQFCNDRRTASETNAELIRVSDTPTSMSPKHQMGIYLRATKDITPREGEDYTEIFTSYQAGYGDYIDREKLKEQPRTKKRARINQAPRKSPQTNGREQIFPRIRAGISLTGEDMQDTLNIIKRHFPGTNGLDDPIHQTEPTYARSKKKWDTLWKTRRAQERSTQIIHVNNDHWIVVEKRNGICLIYDTLRQHTNVKSLEPKIELMFGTTKFTHARGIQQQKPTVAGHTDCGVLAIAILLDLTQGKRNPGKIHYDQHKARPHLIDILTSQEPTPFPTLAAPPTRHTAPKANTPPKGKTCKPKTNIIHPKPFWNNKYTLVEI
jgi:hypothetical protein